MTPSSEDRLLRYLDGEVDSAEAAEVERWLEGSEEARLLLEDLTAVGDAVRAIAAERGAGASDVADVVMARLDAEPAAPRLRTIAGGASGGGAPLAARRWLHLAPAVGLAVAAAATVLWLRPPAPLAPGARQAASPSVSAPPGSSLAARESSSARAEALEAVAGAEAEPGAAIEAVDFGAQNGTIFMVAGGGNATATPVVWLMDDADPGDDRMKPL